MSMTRRTFSTSIMAGTSMMALPLAAAMPRLGLAAGEAMPEISQRFAGTTLRVLFGAAAAWDALTIGAREIADAAGIRLELTNANYSDRYSKLILDASSGANTFDCYVLAYQWKHEAAPFLAPMNDVEAEVPEAAPLDLDDYPPNLLDGYRMDDGTLVGLPIVGDVTFIVRNTDAFDAAGLPLEPPPASWREILANGQKLTTGEQHGFGMPGGKSVQTAIIWILLFHEHGGRYFDESGKPQFDSPASVNAIRFMVEELHKISPPGNITWDYPQILSSFTTGQSAQAMIWSASFGTVNDPARSEVAGKVAWSSTPASTLLGGWAITVNRASANADAGKFFSSWLASRWMTDRLVTLGGAPCRRSTFTNPAFVETFPQFPTLLAALEGPVIQYPSVPQAEQLHILIYDELNAAISGLKAPEQAARDMQAKAVEFMTRRGLL